MKFFSQNDWRLLLIILLALAGNCKAQILKPASWSYAISQKDVKVNDQIDLIFNVKIDKDWYLYSTDFDPDLGPMVTTFNFKPDKSYELVGKIKPVHAKKKHSELWGGEYTYFAKTAQFIQTVKVLDKNFKVNGDVEYQVCTEVDGKCIPFDQDFAFSRQNATQNTVAQTATIDSTPKLAVREKELADTKILKEEKPVAQPKPVTLTASGSESYSLVSFMLLAFLAGMAALITPCVFPMIPMTVTFFTNNSKDRKSAIIKALLFGFSIVAIYTLVGTIVSRINGPEFANWLSTHWMPNLMFFCIFIFFGLSFLGLFEIILPASIVNKMDKEADKGGYYGIIFMAFTIVLVSFSCTGPIVGSILVESAGGAIVKPIAGMFAFSMAFAIPFTLFAVFPNWMKNLPKSGGWLNSVKVVLGFLELALALKFFSTADQVYHWQLLDREVFLALWIAIFSGMALYLLGKIRLPHDSELKSIGVPRMVFAILTISFVIYLIPGLLGAPLKSLAGFLPPMNTQDFNLNLAAAQNSTPTVSTLCETPDNPASLSFPHGIQGYFDLKQAVACAKKQNKPIFIDFTGHGCVNCRKMEERVWVEPEVLGRLKSDFVVVALYIDEKTELPESKWYTSKYDQKVKKTIGGQNVDMQITRFQNNAQPYYVILDPNTEDILVQPIAYETDVNKFVGFLDSGTQKFKVKSTAATLALQ
ncbi:cytochrome c biogenesis protein CcdA [Dyadobacter bucti]|uniref:protein-disulfide reductase DsbD family protein n=1 Tax=Dyadobacter bucti TaxID=2572203 RepID=UPI003F6E9B6A